MSLKTPTKAERTDIEIMLNNIKSLDVGTVFKEVIEFNEDFIIDLNKGDQLYNDGLDAEGNELKRLGNPFTNSGYAPITVKIKKAKGQKTANITLEDSGKFYRSFRLKVTKGSFTIIANTKKDETDLIDEWGPILGLTNENVQLLNEKILQEVINLTKQKIFQSIG